MISISDAVPLINAPPGAKRKHTNTSASYEAQRHELGYPNNRNYTNDYSGSQPEAWDTSGHGLVAGQIVSASIRQGHFANAI
jgi:hypothetical protein